MKIMIGKTPQVAGIGVTVACLVIVSGLWCGGCAMGVTRTGQHDGGGLDSATGDSATPQLDSGPDPALCGNGVTDPGEGCDDGNTIGGDGCSASCQSEDCSPANCSGCCDAGNVCQGGTQDGMCGSAGAACQDCTSSGFACLGNTCQQLGSCTPGEQQPCGDCGTMTCDSQGQWGSCGSQGVCAENQTEMGSGCGNCGIQERTCNSTCQWGMWTCVGELACSQGETETGGTCGNCGHDERTCQSNCQWGGWSCVGEGVCATGQTDTGGTCGGTGTEGRTCDASCQWGSWVCIGGCSVAGHMGNGENGDSCSGVPAESWRCAYSTNWGSYISQVCRNGNWLTCEILPGGCSGCCDSYSVANCGDCV